MWNGKCLHSMLGRMMEKVQNRNVKKIIRKMEKQDKAEKESICLQLETAV